jgi:hypothetical protein
MDGPERRWGRIFHYRRRKGENDSKIQMLSPKVSEPTEITISVSEYSSGASIPVWYSAGCRSEAILFQGDSTESFPFFTSFQSKCSRYFANWPWYHQVLNTGEDIIKIVSKDELSSLTLENHERWFQVTYPCQLSPDPLAAWKVLFFSMTSIDQSQYEFQFAVGRFSIDFSEF